MKNVHKKTRHISQFDTPGDFYSLFEN